MDLTAYPTEMLLQELNARGTHGVVALTSKATGRVEVWWGDRVACLGLTTRLTSSINTEMDGAEETEEMDDEPEELGPLPDFPQMGMYL